MRMPPSTACSASLSCGGHASAPPPASPRVHQLGLRERAHWAATTTLSVSVTSGWSSMVASWGPRERSVDRSRSSACRCRARLTLQLLGDVGGGHRAEEAPGLAGLGVHGDGQLAQRWAVSLASMSAFFDAPAGRLLATANLVHACSGRTITARCLGNRKLRAYPATPRARRPASPFCHFFSKQNLHEVTASPAHGRMRR